MKRRNKSQPAKGYVFAAVGVLRQLPKIRTRVLCAIFCFPFGLWGQADAAAIESPVPQVKPAETAPIDIRIPGRLRRLIAPMPSAPWHAPDLRGYQTEAFPAPKDVASTGFFRDLATGLPMVNLRWLLLDFGRRSSAMDAAKQNLLAANLGFNRKHQEIIYRVQHAFLTLASVRAKIAVAESSVNSARAVRESAEERLRNGLATITDVSLARQQEAQAAFDLEAVLAAKPDAEVALAESIGIPPTTPVQITEFPALTPPATLEASVDKVVDQALERRPDLIAKVAALRSKEAEVRRARAASRPTLGLSANFNTMVSGVQVAGGTASTGWFSSTQPSGGRGFLLSGISLMGGRPSLGGDGRG
jgi:Outer membrane efflux protein